MKSDFITKLFRFNIVLAFIEGLFVLWQYSKIPSESGVAVFLGFSLLRLVLLGGILLVLFAIGSLFMLSLRPAWWEQKWDVAITHMLGRIELFWFLVLVFGSIYVFLFSSEHYLGSLALHRTRLTPILTWGMLAALQGAISFLFSRAYVSQFFEKYRDILLPSAVAFSLLGVALLFIVVTRIGLTPDAVYWQEAGVPLLFLQVWAAWMIGLCFYLLARRFDLFSSKRIDLLVSLGLWMIASVAWLTQPLAPAYNALEPKAPNFQMYPFGDALLYDVMAHGFLVGKPIPSDFWVKPLYSFFLSFLHLFAKDNFGLLVLLQVVILATIPVFVFLLTSELGNRPAGLVAALLVIVRERNGIALSNVIEVSHSKLLMSDVFTMGLVALTAWLIVKWIQQPATHRSLPLVIGGLVALLTLTRGHPILLLPVILCIFLLPRDSFRWRNIVLVLLGFLVPMIPWLWRNYQTMGKFALQNPISAYSAQAAGLYSMTPSLVASPKVLSETDSAYYERLQQQVVQFVFQHPLEFARFTSAHYAHNVIFSYMYLPQSFKIDNLRTYTKTEGLWRGWDGDLNTQNRILLFLNIAVIAIGLGCAWKNIKWYALVPLLIGIGYNLSVSIGRLSGWRFILPVDWITLIYYAIGLMQISYLVVDLLSGKRQPLQAAPETGIVPQNNPYRSVVGFGVVFLSIGMLLTYGNLLFTGRTAPAAQHQIIDAFQKQGGALTKPEIEKFLMHKDAVLLDGRALYPAFFKSDSGLLNYYWRSFETRPYSRLVFYLLGRQSMGIILRMDTQSFIFPDGADVIVLGCKTETGDINALSVLITSTDAPMLYNREPLPELTCPFSE